MIRIKRVYEPPSEDDGYRVLVDGLWPRGVAKEKAKIDLWFREIAPSHRLRKWFSHDPSKWPEFRERYRQELEDKRELVDTIKMLEERYGTVTLLYSARDTRHNNAVVLKEYLDRQRRDNYKGDGSSENVHDKC